MTIVIEQPKRMKALKSVVIKTSFKIEAGGAMTGDYRSNAPGAVSPATPAQTLITVAVELARMAALEGAAGEFMAAISKSVDRTNSWLKQNGYEPAACATIAKATDK